MERSEKKLAELGRVLSRGRRHEIDEKIRSLRSEAPFEGALRMLAFFFDDSDDEIIKLAIAGLFNDMKESSGRAEVIQSLASVHKPGSRAMLASSCWQSGLDYAEYAVTLAATFMAGDYITSLECFTVLDTCAKAISDDDRPGIISRLEKEISSYDTPKQKLTAELIAILKQ